MHQNSLSKDMPAMDQACASFLVRCPYLVDALWVFIYDAIKMSEFLKFCKASTLFLLRDTKVHVVLHLYNDHFVPVN